MTRQELLQRRSESWGRLAALLRTGERARGAGQLSPGEIDEVSRLYRSLASDLMRVKRDKLGSDLERQLDGLAARAHNLIYGGSNVGRRLSPGSLVADFPGALRRNWRFFVLACLLFFGVGGAAGFAAYVDESYALAVMSPAQLAQFEEMYSMAEPGARGADQHAAMTGFYIQNNVGIAFRCFATGLIFGFGSMFYLLFNGLMIGVTFGHLARVGLGAPIFTFVSAHGPWELIASAIAGGAGIQMGYAMVVTYGRTRLGHLQAHGLELLRQVVGAALFLLLAALIEGWVSPSGLIAEGKYALGGIGWVLVGAILIGVGRDRGLPPDVAALPARRGDG